MFHSLLDYKFTKTFSGLPFYRITILLDGDKIVQGIREHTNSNIDSSSLVSGHKTYYVTNLYRAKASAAYGKKLVDIEAAMLSKHSTAVKNYMEDKLKRIEKNKQWPHLSTSDSIETKDRKKNYNNKPTLGERSENND
jgi:hypothetical protein